MAKTFTAAGVWWLAQERRIELDAPVRAKARLGGAPVYTVMLNDRARGPLGFGMF